MANLIISVSGLRGTVGETLTPPVLMDYAAAVAGLAGPGALVLGRDGRHTGPALADIVAGTLAASGRDVLDAGIVATPTVGRLAKQGQAAGAIQISASHNPPEYNGLKVFSPEGRVVSAGLGESIRSRFQLRDFRWAGPESLGQRIVLSDTTSDHLSAVLSLVDVDRIRARRFRVLLDSNAGAGSVLGRLLLEQLHCRTEVFGGDPTGKFLHPPEPTVENLAEIAHAARALDVDVGFCQDPDADRLAVIDRSGRYIGEEYTLALCADHVLRQLAGPIVTNCSTSRMIQDLAVRHGAPFYRTKVGEAHVADQMIACGAVFGGEGNGGPIDPRVGYVRDSFVGMALILDAMSGREGGLNGLVDALPKYHLIKAKASLDPDSTSAALAAVEQRFPDAQVDTQDGLRLDWSDCWLLIRGSNTEPIVRICAEAPTEAAARQLVETASSVISSLRR